MPDWPRPWELNMLETPGTVLVVTPHPDDAEGGCGGTVAKWVKQGSEVVYVLCTNGDKGTTDHDMTPEKLASIREAEQLEAARLVGVKEVVFLRYPDGSLEDNRRFRGQVVREIRRHRPDVLMCIDPFKPRGHSHRDHRVSGQVAVDAVCTYAWRRLYFPEHSIADGLQPHLVKEVYLWGSGEPDTYVDIGDTIDIKVQALVAHASQFADPEAPGQRVRDNARRVGEQANVPYAEGFRVIHFVPDPLLVV